LHRLFTPQEYIIIFFAEDGNHHNSIWYLECYTRLMIGVLWFFLWEGLHLCHILLFFFYTLMQTLGYILASPVILSTSSFRSHCSCLLSFCSFLAHHLAHFLNHFLHASLVRAYRCHIPVLCWDWR
jgi:hypothetical protein